jgi:hypothetical protein
MRRHEKIGWEDRNEEGDQSDSSRAAQFGDEQSHPAGNFGHAADLHEQTGRWVSGRNNLLVSPGDAKMIRPGGDKANRREHPQRKPPFIFWGHVEIFLSSFRRASFCAKANDLILADSHGGVAFV